MNNNIESTVTLHIPAGDDNRRTRALLFPNEAMARQYADFLQLPYEGLLEDVDHEITNTLIARERGFTVEDTGGGCRVFRMEGAIGYEAFVSNEADIVAPFSSRCWAITFRNAGGNEVDYREEYDSLDGALHDAAIGLTFLPVHAAQWVVLAEMSDAFGNPATDVAYFNDPVDAAGHAGRMLTEGAIGVESIGCTTVYFGRFKEFGDFDSDSTCLPSTAYAAICDKIKAGTVTRHDLIIGWSAEVSAPN